MSRYRDRTQWHNKHIGSGTTIIASGFPTITMKSTDPLKFDRYTIGLYPA
jgi:hypothetical protein